MTISEADILRSVKQKLAEFEASYDKATKDDADSSAKCGEKSVNFSKHVEPVN